MFIVLLPNKRDLERRYPKNMREREREDNREREKERERE
jgi:hypothetical protein